MPAVAAKTVARKAKERIVSEPWGKCVQCEVAQEEVGRVGEEEE